MTRALAALLLACPTTNIASAQEDHVVVDTSYGSLRGLVQDDVVIFRGIPFAAPPVGELRWRAPSPPAAWDGVRDAFEFGPACPQVASDIEMSEDYLYLNVWTPRERNGELLPVMFWIHGGGFVNGSGSDPLTDGTALALDGAVVVSPNYRLGRFGLFAHPVLTAEDADDGHLGNYWLLDQVLALEWVRDNIEGFGGDPDRITIFGSSAGGISVNCLMISPIARGLFSRAIAQSSARTSNAPPLTAAAGIRSEESKGLAFAARHGIQGSGPDALARLRSLSAENIVDGLHMGTIDAQDFSYFTFDGTVIPASVEACFREGVQAGVPYIAGGNDADGFYPFRGGTRDEVFASFGELRPEAEALYDPGGEGDLRRYGTYAGADLDFLEPTRRIARLHAANDHPTWLYRFSYVHESLRANRIGAWHASEAYFLFGTRPPYLSGIPSENDTLTGGRLRAYWLAFARTGRPTPDGLPDWPRYDATDDVLLHFLPGGPVAQPDPARDRLDLVEAAVDSRR